MTIKVTNQAAMVGDYDGEELTLNTTIAETTLVEGMVATKAASKTLWAGGTMTYTVVVTNDTDIDYESPIFTDLLDSHITYVADSLKINDVPYANHSYAGQLLTVNMETLPANTAVTLTFEVEQA